MTSLASLTEALDQMRRDPGVLATLESDEISVGFRLRREVRAVLESAERGGARVAWDEQRGLFASTFSFRMSGTGGQLAGPLSSLLELVGGDS